MINVLANKLPSLPDNKNLIWKNSNDDLYKKFSQYDKLNDALPILKNAPQISEKSNEIQANPTVPTVSTVSTVSTVLSEKPIINKIPKVLKVSPIKIFNDRVNISNSVDVPNVPNVTNVTNVTKQLNPIKETKKNVKKPNPIDTILLESSTCDIYKNDVKEKLITLIASNEFSKVFGLTKSSEIMTGIVNERINKSIALFISFLFDKCVIYNDKEFIFNKNKETIGTIKI